MRNSGFGSGVLLGLLIGVVSGGLGVLLLLPAPRGGPGEVEELKRSLEAARSARERADKQLEQFAAVAEQMKRSFENLEARFKVLDAEVQDRKRLESATPASR